MVESDAAIPGTKRRHDLTLPSRKAPDAAKIGVAELAQAQIKRHFAAADGCGVGTIAAQLRISRSLLCRHYRAAYRTTIGKDIRRLRIDKARELMESRPQQLMKEIASEAGYRRHSYRSFLNAFQAETGMLPSQYRRWVRMQAPHSKHEP